LEDPVADAVVGIRCIADAADENPRGLFDSLPLVRVAVATLIVVAIWLVSLHYSWIVI
jgi:hypothetical protein